MFDWVTQVGAKLCVADPPYSGYDNTEQVSGSVEMIKEPTDGLLVRWSTTDEPSNPVVPSNSLLCGGCRLFQCVLGGSTGTGSIQLACPWLPRRDREPK